MRCCSLCLLERQTYPWCIAYSRLKRSPCRCSDWSSLVEFMSVKGSAPGYMLPPIMIYSGCP